MASALLFSPIGVEHHHWRHRDVAPGLLAPAAGRVAHAQAVEGEDEPPDPSIPPPVRFEFVADRLKRAAKEKERIDRPVEEVVEAEQVGAEGLQHSSRKEGEMEIPDLSGVASSSTSVPRFVFAHQDPGRRYRDDREILLEDWTETYKTSVGE